MPAIAPGVSPDGVLQQVLLLTQACEMLQVQQAITNNLQLNLRNFEREANDHADCIQGLVDIGDGHARTIRRAQRELTQAETGAAFHRTALAAAQTRLTIGRNRLATLNAEVAELVRAAARQGRVIVLEVDLVGLQERLFGVDAAQADAAPLQTGQGAGQQTQAREGHAQQPQLKDGGDESAKRKPWNSSEAKALQARIKEVTSRERNFRNAALEVRSLAVNTYFELRTALDNHRADYRRMRDRHFAGEDPGFPGWLAAWTREDFDREHVREWMRLSEAISEVYKIMQRMMEIATRAGIEPLEWQETGFWQPGSMHYASSVEQAMIDAAPEEEVLTWDDGLAQNAGGLAGAVALRDARMASGYPVDWPHDEQVYQPAPELVPRDSASCVALEYEQERNDRYAGPRPQGWTLGAGMGRPEAKAGQHKLSHLF
ncbi:hypothetical protein LTR85_002511 [Meristemomyces frigidus]|nr:hypothetical protein LTR85_002511 [Meristemomyces frigidus]